MKALALSVDADKMVEDMKRRAQLESADKEVIRDQFCHLAVSVAEHEVVEEDSPKFDFRPYSRQAHLPKNPEQSECISSLYNHDTQSSRTKPMYKIDSCPHTDAKYYAKGMCIHCYHSKGRTKPATECPHKDRPSYAKDMCINCYQSQ